MRLGGLGGFAEDESGGFCVIIDKIASRVGEVVVKRKRRKG